MMTGKEFTIGKRGVAMDCLTPDERRLVLWFRQSTDAGKDFIGTTAFAASCQALRNSPVGKMPKGEIACHEEQAARSKAKGRRGLYLVK